MNKITIFTPTYNRAYTLKRLYDSIKVQEYENFEWIIVDDGSKDNTKELIQSFIDEKKVDIKYFFQENSGKHIAINKGVEEATGNLFFIVDSDDYITSDALNIINKWEKTIKEDKFIGIVGLRIYPDNNIIGSTFHNSNNYIDATSLEKYKYNITGDKSEVCYTDILKKYKFPKIDDEKFMTEAYIWNKIARDELKFRWFNEPLIVCEYRDDGLTKNIRNIYKKYPKGQLLYLKESMEFEEDFMRKLKVYYWYVEIAKDIYSNKEIKTHLKIGNIKLYSLLLMGKVKNFLNKKLRGEK